MEFRILGPLEALEEGRAVSLGGSKQRALLAVFLLHANETLSADRLIDELWGERPPATALKTVRVYVSRLRRALAGGEGNGSPGVVATREHGYELSLDPERLDAHRFERLVAEGRGELAAGRPERAAATVEEGLSLWRGPPLADLAYEPFAQREAARLEDLRIDALEQLIEAKLALGRHGEVIGRLEALIAEHPYRERLRAQLMLALYRSERQADALQAYQDARRTLVEQLGIEPGERLRELERAILAQDPQLNLAAAKDGPTAEPTVEAPRGAFVGRERELDELAAGLDDALAGRGRLFLIGGEPGIGKSRLAEALVAQAGARGAGVLLGRCWEAGGAPAYWPWLQALRAYVRDSDGAVLREQLGPGAADLAQLLPELRERFPGLPEPPAPESHAARFRLFDAVAEFLSRACESRPSVLVLDDLHAADAPSLLLLRFVARQLDSTRMLVLAAYRDVDPLPGQPLTEALAELTREPVTRRLPLGGLSEPQVAEYLEATAPAIASAELPATLYEETEGNPLFVGEIVRLLSVEGVPPRDLVIPQSVRDVIARRLSHLSDECNWVLVLAAVLGREFAVDALGRVARVSEDELLDALDEAIGARVLCDVPGTAHRLRFTHMLIRDTLYEGLTSARRVQLHRRAVEALEALHGEDAGPYLAELAHHCRAGRELDRALSYAWNAADRAVTQLGYEEAVRLYEIALEALELKHPVDEAARCRLQLALAEAQARGGLMDRARLSFLDAADFARRLNLPDELARAALGYGGRFAWPYAAVNRRLVRLLEEALAAVPDGDSALRATLLARLAGALRSEPSMRRRAALTREAVQIARRLDDPATLAYSLEAAYAGVSPGDAKAWLAIGNELTQVARSARDKEREFIGLLHSFGALMVLGDIGAADVRLEAIAALVEDLRQPTQQRGLEIARTMRALFAGRFQEADNLIQKALDAGPGTHGFEVEWFWVVRVQAWALGRERGRLPELRSDIERLADEYPLVPYLQPLLATLYSELGCEAEAREKLETLARRDFADLVDSDWLPQVSLLSQVCAFLGDPRHAADLYEPLLPYARCNVLAYPELSLGSASRYLGLLASTLSRWTEAARHFEAALEMNAEMGARPWVAHTQHDYANMLLGRDEPTDRERALQLIADALTTYRELGMDSWAEAASELVRVIQPASAPAR